MDVSERVSTTAERLREAMHEAGKKQVDMVRETGLNKSTISRYLSGEVDPKSSAINKLARVLDVSEMWLWGFDAPKARQVVEKRNDDLIKVMAQLRKDPDFLEVVSLLAKLPAEQYASVKTILAALGDK